MRKVTLTDFLNEPEIELAIKLKTAKDICEQITKPNIDRINKNLGQENDPMYLAYLIVYVINFKGVTYA